MNDAHAPTDRPRQAGIACRVVSTAVALFAALALVGCGGTGSGYSGNAQPAPKVTNFAPGGLDDVPKVPTSKPYGPETVSGATATRSFGVRGISPEGVMLFYEQTLADAAVTTPRDKIGPKAFREAWKLGNGDTLTVSSIGGVQAPPDADPPDQYNVQYSLRLERG